MTARMQAEPGAIEHVRNCGKRVPICGMEMRERPQNGRRANAGDDVGVLVNVKVIIIVYKVVT